MLKTYDDETEQAPAGDIVIDPFLGSRSRLIGCEKTGRRCVPAPSRITTAATHATAAVTATAATATSTTTVSCHGG
jgi:hypothetical protein